MDLLSQFLRELLVLRAIVRHGVHGGWVRRAAGPSILKTSHIRPYFKVRGAGVRTEFNVTDWSYGTESMSAGCVVRQVRQS